MPNVRFKFGGAQGVAFANGEFTVAPSPAALGLLLARAGLTAVSEIIELSADDVTELATAARTGTNILPPPS